MGRCSSDLFAVILGLLIGGLAGCGTSSTPASPTPPASISLSASSASLEVGATENFSASAKNSSGRPVLVAVTFNSSNPAVLTIANNGLACGGTWDSLTNPIVCTPGSVGVALVTASALGASSPPVTIYVHQHVDRITVTPVPTPMPPVCFSQNQTSNYQATVSSHNNDITPTVGPLTWTAVNSNVVKLNNAVSGVGANQVQATASIPGVTGFFVTAAGVNSPAMTFTTCPVQSITLAVTGSATNSFSISSGSKEVTATVVDSQDVTLTNVPLTWSTSDAAVVTVPATPSSAATVSAAHPGGAAIIASCTPPTCNGGFVPTKPVYPTSIVRATVTGTTPSTTVWATSTGCGTNFNCGSSIVPISTSNNILGSSTSLPNPPNSLVFNPQGSRAFIGSSKGLMVLDPTANPPTVSTFNTVTGKVVAVSRDGNRVVVSDTTSTLTPNQVFIFDDNNTGSPVDLLITGATAADFSPDGLKAYIVAGGNLYAYSSLDGLKKIALAGPANDVSFFPNGAFAYLAGGASSPAVTVRVTCNNSIAMDGVNNQQILAMPTGNTPTSIKAVSDGIHVLALDSPVGSLPSSAEGIDVITATTAPVGCPPTVSNASPPISFVNLGQGTFTPIQFLVSSDGTKAYVLANNLGIVMVYDVGSGTSSAIALAGSAKPLSASLAPDGTLLYVAANDGTVHAVNTVVGGDFQQISFPGNFCSNVSFTCTADLVAVRP